MAFDIICLSHLAFEVTLFQRPQHLMVRMAERGHRVLYCGCVGTRRTKEIRRQPQVTVTPARLAIAHLPYHPLTRHLETPRRMLTASSIRRSADEMFAPEPNPRLLWLYHPGLLPLAQRLGGGRIVFDMMDRFRSFTSSASDTHEQERRVVRSADQLFSGGRSLQRDCENLLGGGAARRPLCFPSGVDISHFRSALSNETTVPAELARLPRPVFGYIGAVDERIDWLALRALATAQPNASVVMIGPVLAADLPPMPPNVHILGARPYNDLPSWLKGFDVALIPFRITDLVTHVSPTKTPEYLAAGRMVVSTAVPDVKADWGDVVKIAQTPAQFAEACAASVAHPTAPETLSELTTQRAHTWEQIAADMEQALEEIL